MSKIDDLIKELCPDGVERKKLGDLVYMSWGDTSKTKSSYIDGNFGFVAYSAAGADGLLEDFQCDGEGIVLSAIGARCGKTWFAQGQWTCIKNTIFFYADDKNQLDNKFLY